MWERWLIVLAGGAAGSLARYLVSSAIMNRLGGRFPWGTLLVNVSGCFLIGVLMTLLTERFQPHPNWRLGLVVGFLGGYTTFSAFEYETYLAVRAGSLMLGILNVSASVILGYLALWLGALVAGKQ
jgi:fluoride exporter